VADSGWLRSNSSGCSFDTFLACFVIVSREPFNHRKHIGPVKKYGNHCSPPLDAFVGSPAAIVEKIEPGTGENLEAWQSECLRNRSS